MRDMFGNELANGDHVHVKFGNEWVMAQIIKIQNGGLAVTGIPKNPRDQVGVTPDALVLQFAVGFVQQPPGSNHITVMKLDTAKVREGVIESTLKM